MTKSNVCWHGKDDHGWCFSVECVKCRDLIYMSTKSQSASSVIRLLRSAKWQPVERGAYLMAICPECKARG